MVDPRMHQNDRYIILSFSRRRGSSGEDGSISV